MSSADVFKEAAASLRPGRPRQSPSEDRTAAP
jgi:hypothetical protein